MKTIRPDDYDLPDDRITAWLEANGIDPTLLPAEQDIDVSGDELEFQSWARDASGQKVQLVPFRALRVMTTVPHKSRPEAHGLGHKSRPGTINAGPGTLVLNGTVIPLELDGSFIATMTITGPTTLS